MHLNFMCAIMRGINFLVRRRNLELSSLTSQPGTVKVVAIPRLQNNWASWTRVGLFKKIRPRWCILNIKLPQFTSTQGRLYCLSERKLPYFQKTARCVMGTRLCWFAYVHQECQQTTEAVAPAGAGNSSKTSLNLKAHWRHIQYSTPLRNQS